MKTKYRIVMNFNDKFQCQHKKWYWMDWRNIEALTPRNYKSDAVDNIETYKRKLAYDKNKTVVWQSDQTEVKETKGRPWRVVLPIWKYYLIVVTCVVAGYWIGSHLHK